MTETITGVILMGGSGFHHKSLISSPQTHALALGRSAGCSANSSFDSLMACIRGKEVIQLLLADATMSKSKVTKIKLENIYHCLKKMTNFLFLLYRQQIYRHGDLRSRETSYRMTHTGFSEAVNGVSMGVFFKVIRWYRRVDYLIISTVII